MGVARIVTQLASPTVQVALTLAPTPTAPGEAEPSRLRDLGLPLARLRHRGPPSALAAF
jgi:hypothetical protein